MGIFMDIFSQKVHSKEFSRNASLKLFQTTGYILINVSIDYFLFQKLKSIVKQ